MIVRPLGHKHIRFINQQNSVPAAAMVVEKLIETTFCLSLVVEFDALEPAAVVVVEKLVGASVAYPWG